MEDIPVGKKFRGESVKVGSIKCLTCLYHQTGHSVGKVRMSQSIESLQCLSQDQWILFDYQ